MKMVKNQNSFFFKKKITTNSIFKDENNTKTKLNFKKK